MSLFYIHGGFVHFKIVSSKSNCAVWIVYLEDSICYSGIILFDLLIAVEFSTSGVVHDLENEN